MQSNALPATIIHPEAFLRERPAGYDGVFNWDWILPVLPRNIRPCDVDAEIESNNFFLKFETKQVGKDLDRGQRMKMDRDLNSGLSTWVTIWGKWKPIFFRIETPLCGKASAIRFPILKTGMLHAGEAGAAIVKMVEAWFDFVDSLSATAWVRALEAAVFYQEWLAVFRECGISADFPIERPLPKRSAA